MSRLAKWWLTLAFLFICPSLVRAQTISAASCSRADVAAALAAVNSSTTLLNIPAGTCHWGNGSALGFSAPKGSTNLTIQGQTVCTGSGDPASNNLVCTDNTVIINDDTTDTDHLLNISPASTTTLLRITGITINAGANTEMSGAVLEISGTFSGSPNFRVDHNHINQSTYTGAAPLTNNLFITGCIYGVVDHNIIDFSNGPRANGIVVWEPSCGGSSWGDYNWSQPAGFGGSQFVYAEANVFNGTVGGGSASLQADDCFPGCKAVFRFNTFHNSKLQTHPTGGAGPNRGAVAMEIYGNSFNAANIGTVYNITAAHFISSGQLMMWGNKINMASDGKSGYATGLEFVDCRSPLPTSRCGYGLAGTPGTGGWGGCGQSPLARWDGNVSGGYPCIDQPGRGQSDLLGGSFTANNRVDTVTGTATWPNQKLSPIYYWLNSYTALPNGNGTADPVNLNGSIWTQNVDYYVSSNPNSGTDCNGFTGATGIGCGPRSSRPSNCTTGVAWWSTDQGAWNQTGNGFGSGVLDICASTNNWTDASYTPYAYPHPLAGGSVTPPPAAPTNLKVVVN
jgi:hypothetical protein